MLEFKTSHPTDLLRRIKQAIDDGTVKTWSYDAQGDFTHTPSQWARKGWLRPQVTTTGLTLTFLAPTSGASRETYAVYSGRYQEMMMAHFFKSYTVSTCTPAPASGDSAVAA